LINQICWTDAILSLVIYPAHCTSCRTLNIARERVAFAGGHQHGCTYSTILVCVKLVLVRYMLHPLRWSRRQTLTTNAETQFCRIHSSPNFPFCAFLKLHSEDIFLRQHQKWMIFDRFLNVSCFAIMCNEEIL